MAKLTAALVVALGISGFAWAQEGREKPKPEPTMTLKEIDTNKDGKLSLAELQAAIEKLKQKQEASEKEKREGGDRPREGGERRREGGDRKRD